MHFYAQVMELMGRDMGQLTHIECSVKRQKWTHVLQALKLTPDQREQLMSNRKEHLNKLRRIFEDRQELNMQAGAPYIALSSPCVFILVCSYSCVRTCVFVLVCSCLCVRTCVFVHVPGFEEGQLRS